MTRRLPQIRMLMVVMGCAILAACAGQGSSSDGYAISESPADKPGVGYKIGKPYQIGGVWYYPAEDYNYSETGIASWYGPDFHGKYTANGELYDQNDLTAAHRTLPMPCFLRVTNLENGRSLVVRVNDRGPFAHSRIIDLSRRAAQLLGIAERGTARVRVDIMAEESRALALRLKGNSPEEPKVVAAPRETVQAESLPPPGSRETARPVAAQASAPRMVGAANVEPALGDQQVKLVPVKPTQLYIQAGAFARYDNANRVHAALGNMGPTVISQVQTKGGTLFRVRMGPLSSVDAADALLEKVIGSGYPDAKIVVD